MNAAGSTRAVTQAVTLPALLELMDSLALLVRRGDRPWHLDVVWDSHDSPWYVAACRRRSADLGLEAHVRFLGPTGPTGSSGPQVTSPAERCVLLLEPMADRRRRRREEDGPARATGSLGGSRAAAVARYRAVAGSPTRHRVDTTA